MMLLIQFTFETLINMINLAYAGLDKLVPGFLGALPTPAYQDDWNTALCVVFNDTSKNKLPDLGNEMGIDNPVGLINPRYVDSALGMADKQVFHAGADINQYGARIFIDQFPRLFGRKAF